MTALLPCPFCGGVAEIRISSSGTRYFGACETRGCRIDGPVRATQDDAIAAWNRRATPAEVDALRAEASEYCQTVQLLEDRNATLRARVEKLEGALRNVSKDIASFYEPWGSWKTAWWEGIGMDACSFSDGNMLRYVASKIRAGLGDAT